MVVLEQAMVENVAEVGMQLEAFDNNNMVDKVEEALELDNSSMVEIMEMHYKALV